RCAQWGRFLCLFKGGWSKGIPFLAQGGDGPLKDIAGREIARPTDGRAQSDLAGSYMQLTMGEKNWLIRRNLALHARGWLERALANSRGKLRTSVEQRIRGIEDRLADDEALFGPRQGEPTPRQLCDRLVHDGRSNCTQGKLAAATEAFQKVLAMKPNDS